MKLLTYITGKHSKRIFRGIMLWVGIQGVLWGFGFDGVMASSIGDAIQEKVYTYNSILNILYLLLRPALTLAGMALDNSMVYGSFLNLDAPLWLIWNIVKNIANFALGFMVLFEILKNFFTTQEQGKKAFSIIKKALIAGVLIQSSWFLMAAVIDVSTIITYSIGGLPISAIKNQCPDIGNTKILGVGSKIDFTTQNQNTTLDNSFMYYYYAGQNTDKKNFAPCVVKDNKWIVGQKYRGTVSNIDFKKDYCILGNNQFVWFGNGQIATNTSIISQYTGLQTPSDSNQIYQNNLTNLLAMTGNQQLFTGRAANGLIFNVWSGTLPVTQNTAPGIYKLNDVLNYTSGTTLISVFDGAPELKNILDQAEGFVGVMISLYKSILNFASFNTTSGSTDTFVMFLEILLKTAFGIAILVPLIITAVALIIRIGFIWMFIALSPLIALKIAFGDEDSNLKSILDKIPIIGEGIGSLLRIIFAPVLICFTVTICMLFMSVLISSLKNEKASPCLTDRQTIWRSFNIESTNPTENNPNGSYQINGLVEVQQSALGLDVQEGTKDIFGWFLINIFGAAVTWLILMSVIEIVFKGTGVEKRKLGNIAGSLLGSIPIIPVPTQEGLKFIGGGTAAAIANEGATKIKDRSNPTVRADEFLGRNKPKDETDKTGNTNNTGGGATFISAPAITNTNNAATTLADNVVSSGINSIDAATIFKDNSTLKGTNKEALQKSVFTNPEVRTALATKITAETDPTKKQTSLTEVKDWFVANTAKFNSTEIKSLWSADDVLAKQLSPYITTATPATVKTAEGGFEVTFDATNGTYDFVDKPDATTSFTTLIGKTPTITDRNKDRATLMQ